MNLVTDLTRDKLRWPKTDLFSHFGFRAGLAYGKQRSQSGECTLCLFTLVTICFFWQVEYKPIPILALGIINSRLPNLGCTKAAAPTAALASFMVAEERTDVTVTSKAAGFPLSQS